MCVGGGGGVKVPLLPAFTLDPDVTLYTEKYKTIRFSYRLPTQSKRKYKSQIHPYDKQRRVLMANSTVWQSKCKPIVEPRRAKPKTNHQAPTQWLKFYEEAVVESEARTAVVQLNSEA